MLMDSWRKRMTNGDTINLEELRMGLGLGADLDECDEDDRSVTEDIEGEADEDASSIFDEVIEEEADEDFNGVNENDEEPRLPSPEKSMPVNGTDAIGMFKLKLQPSQAALRESNGNKTPIRSPRKVAFSASIPNTPSQMDGENADALQVDIVDTEKSSRHATMTKASYSEERATRSISQDHRSPRHVRYDHDTELILRVRDGIEMPAQVAFASLHSRLRMFEFQSDTLSQAKKRLSSPHVHPDEPSPKLTVQDKLRVVQAEAETAALKAASPKKKTTVIPADVLPSPRRAPRSPVKSRIGGRAKRRKSTLTPEELEKLLMG